MLSGALRPSVNHGAASEVAGMCGVKMARGVTFSTVFFNERGGYQITDIGSSVYSYGFKQALRGIQAEGFVDIGLPQPVRGEQLHAILIQLQERPLENGTIAVDLDDVRPTVNYVEANGGFRDSWVIGNNRGGGLGGTVTDDVILAGRGNDQIRAAGGDDYVNGNRGNDLIGGGRGDDHLYGNDGDDILRGRGDNDILQGGRGSDTLSGNQGADTFYFTSADFGGGPSVDVIRDYRPNQGDQIVDITGRLQIEHVGLTPLFGNGTVLVNPLTGDRIFVRGAELRDADIKNVYVEPDPAEIGAVSMPRKGIYVGGQPSEAPPSISLNTALVDSYLQGTTFIETYQVSANNLTDRTITNIDQLQLRVNNGLSFDVVPNSLFGGTFRAGLFDLAAGGRRSLAPEGQLDILQFSVANRPVDQPVSFQDTSVSSFVPQYAGNQRDYNQPAFRITVTLSETTDTGGTAEVYIRNIGNQVLKDLDNMEFRFNDRNIDVTDDIWGAVFFDNKFAVEPWAENAPHGELNLNERTKLFGFSYEVDKKSDAEVEVSDFLFNSDFQDLIN